MYHLMSSFFYIEYFDFTTYNNPQNTCLAMWLLTWIIKFLVKYIFYKKKNWVRDLNDWMLQLCYRFTYYFLNLNGNRCTWNSPFSSFNVICQTIKTYNWWRYASLSIILTADNKIRKERKPTKFVDPIHRFLWNVTLGTANIHYQATVKSYESWHH